MYPDIACVAPRRICPSALGWLLDECGIMGIIYSGQFYPESETSAAIRSNLSCIPDTSSAIPSNVLFVEETFSAMPSTVLVDLVQ